MNMHLRSTTLLLLLMVTSISGSNAKSTGSESPTSMVDPADLVNVTAEPLKTGQTKLNQKPEDFAPIVFGAPDEPPAPPTPRLKTIPENGQQPIAACETAESCQLDQILTAFNITQKTQMGLMNCLAACSSMTRNPNFGRPLNFGQSRNFGRPPNFGQSPNFVQPPTAALSRAKSPFSFLDITLPPIFRSPFDIFQNRLGNNKENENGIRRQFNQRSGRLHPIFRSKNNNRRMKRLSPSRNNIRSNKRRNQYENQQVFSRRQVDEIVNRVNCVNAALGGNATAWMLQCLADQDYPADQTTHLPGVHFAWQPTPMQQPEIKLDYYSLDGLLQGIQSCPSSVSCIEQVLSTTDLSLQHFSVNRNDILRKLCDEDKCAQRNEQCQSERELRRELTRQSVCACQQLAADQLSTVNVSCDIHLPTEHCQNTDNDIGRNRRRAPRNMKARMCQTYSESLTTTTVPLARAWTNPARHGKLDGGQFAWTDLVKRLGIRPV